MHLIYVLALGSLQNQEGKKITGYLLDLSRSCRILLHQSLGDNGCSGWFWEWCCFFYGQKHH